MDPEETPGSELAASSDRGGLPDRLTPIAHGWPIRRAYGSSTWQLAPPRAQPLVRLLSWVPAVGLFGATATLYFTVAHRGHVILPWYLFVAKGGTFKVGIVAAAGAGLSRLWGRTAAWFLRRTAVVYGRIAGIRPPLHGQLVRIVGTVRPEASFKSAVSGEPTVFAHYETVPDSTRDRATDGRRRNDVRGIDFLVDTDFGEPVRIHAEDVFITDKPRGSSREPAEIGIVGVPQGGIYREARIAPRDTIEAIGILSYEADPDGERTHPRDLPRRLTLRGTRRFPLLVRRMA